MLCWLLVGKIKQVSFVGFAAEFYILSEKDEFSLFRVCFDRSILNNSCLFKSRNKSGVELNLIPGKVKSSKACWVRVRSGYMPYSRIFLHTPQPPI